MIISYSIPEPCIYSHIQHAVIQNALDSIQGKARYHILVFWNRSAVNTVYVWFLWRSDFQDNGDTLLWHSASSLMNLLTKPRGLRKLARDVSFASTARKLVGCEMPRNKVKIVNILSKVSILVPNAAGWIPHDQEEEKLETYFCTPCHEEIDMGCQFWCLFSKSLEGDLRR